MELLAYYVYGAFCLLGGLALGYYWRGWEDRHATATSEQNEPVTYTSGAAYDACLDDEPTTDHDAEVWDVLYQAKR